MRTHSYSPRFARHVPCSWEPWRRVSRPALGASGNVIYGEWPGDTAETSPAPPHTTVPLSLPPTRSAAVWAMQGRGCPGATCPLPSRACSATHTAMLLALGAPPGNSRIPMGGGSEWPGAPRLEPGEPRPELPAAAKKVRTPVGRPRPLPGAGGRAAPRPLPATSGALGLAVADTQAPESAPGSALGSHRDARLWRPQRVWTRRGRAFRSSLP